MKLNRIIVGILLSILINGNLFAKQEVVINFKDLEINDFIKTTARILDKNILLSSSIKGKVEFVTNKTIYKEDILNILIYVLESKGFTLIEDDDILRVIKLNDAAKYNVPVYNNSDSSNKFMMVTEVFNIDHANVDYVSSKIRHLISKSAKLVSDKESNAIVLTDFSTNINTVKEVISMIAKDSKKEIEIVKLDNIQGSSILSDLQSVSKAVFDEKIEKEKVAILLNKDTNSIMFVGKKENVTFLVKYLKDIESKGSLIEKTVEVIGLKNAESTNVLTILKGIIEQKVYKDQNNKPFASADEEANSIILMGPKDELDYFTKLIDKLDVDKQQVYVKARIIEISETGTSNMGIEYGIEGLSSGGDGALTFAGNFGGPSVALSEAALNTIDLPDVSDGLVLGASINLLKQNYALDLVSEPSLLCINNKESSIYVGETRSISSGTTVGTTTTTNYTREDIGLTLKVKPRISNGNKVTLEITATMEDVTETNGSSEQPNTNKKEVVTTAIVTNGESVILGGLTKNKKESTESKIPFFGDIPLLGGLFRNSSELNDKINLVIIITPYIIPTSEDLSYIRNQLAELKIIEDKYTKDVQLKLDKLKLKEKASDLQRDEEKMDLLIKSEELNKEIEEFEEDKRKYENKKSQKNPKNKYENQLLHEQRLHEMFGI